jgi:hypothetical protein
MVLLRVRGGCHPKGVIRCGIEESICEQTRKAWLWIVKPQPETAPVASLETAPVASLETAPVASLVAPQPHTARTCTGISISKEPYRYIIADFARGSALATNPFIVLRVHIGMPNACCGLREKMFLRENIDEERLCHLCPCTQNHAQ